MHLPLPYRTGEDESLAAEFIQLAKMRRLSKDNLDPNHLTEEGILAVHFADAGAQGDAGAVEILYRSENDLRILYGNYAYGKLDLDAVLRKLPMLGQLDSRDRLRSNPPYPFGGGLHIPSGWLYMYMGCMNHFFVREEIGDKTRTVVEILCRSGRNWRVFDAVAWLCGVQFDS